VGNAKDGKDWARGGGGRRVKEPAGNTQRKAGVDGVKNRSGQWEGPGRGGSSTGALCTGHPLVIIIVCKLDVIIKVFSHKLVGKQHIFHM